MKNFSCKTCGSNNFKKIGNEYICDYCGATLVKTEGYPKKRLFIILLGILILLVSSFMIYQLLNSVKNDIGNLAQTQQKMKTPTQETQTTFENENPFADVILKVEGDFKASKSENTIEKALKFYLLQEMNKAFYISIDSDGNFAYGYAYGAKSIKIAEDKAKQKCFKMRKKTKTKESCIPYAINNQVSSFIID